MLLAGLLILAMLSGGCNDAEQQTADSTGSETHAQAPVETPPKRETTGGNVPPPAKLDSEELPELLFNNFSLGDQKLSDFRGKPTVVNLWAVW